MTSVQNEVASKQESESNGKTVDIKGLVGQMVAGIWVVSGEDMPTLAEYQEKRGDYVVEGGILGRQEKAITYADPKHLKTMVELYKGMCIATGTPFFGYPIKQGRVLYVGMEDTLPKLSKGVNAMKQHFPPIGQFQFTVLETDKRKVPEIEKLIVALTPTVVMIDPLGNLLKREDKKEDVEALLLQLDRLIEVYGISIVLIHHARKQKGETLESMRGSSALTGWADTICRIQRRDGKKDRIKLDFESRHAVEDLEPLKLNFNRTGCTFEEDVTLLIAMQSAIRQELLAVGGSMPMSDLVVKLEERASTRTIQRAVNAMPEVEEVLDSTDKRKRIVRLTLRTR